jgi:hypothetical protein
MLTITENMFDHQTWATEVTKRHLHYFHTQTIKSTVSELLLLLLLLQVYSVKDSNLCLTGTAEVPLAGVYMGKVLNEKVR